MTHTHRQTHTNRQAKQPIDLKASAQVKMFFTSHAARCHHQQLTSGTFQSEQDGHGEPVEAVVDRCASEGELKLPPVRDLGEGDERARQTGSDVGPHHHWNGRSHIQNLKVREQVGGILERRERQRRLLPSLDTIDTMTDVQVEELWTSTVKNTPIMRPTTGFANMSLPWNTLPGMECKHRRKSCLPSQVCPNPRRGVRKSGRKRRRSSFRGRRGVNEMRKYRATA